MLDITLSRSAFSVCMTRLAMRPAKSFWKKGRFWRITCQWLCQRIRLVDAREQRVLAHRHVAQHDERTHEQDEHDHEPPAWRVVGELGLAVRRFHDRHELADEKRNHRVDQRDGEARQEHDAYQPFVCFTKCQ